jgi:hypothetical protein
MSAVFSIVYHGTTTVYMRNCNCSSVLEKGPRNALYRHVVNLHFGMSQQNDCTLLKAYHHVKFQDPIRKMIGNDNSNSAEVRMATMLICATILRRCHCMRHMGPDGRTSHELKRIRNDAIMA